MASIDVLPFNAECMLCGMPFMTYNVNELGGCQSSIPLALRSSKGNMVDICKKCICEMIKEAIQEEAAFKDIRENQCISQLLTTKCIAGPGIVSISSPMGESRAGATPERSKQSGKETSVSQTSSKT